MDIAFLTPAFDSRYEVSSFLEDHIISRIFILIAILNKCGSWNIIKDSMQKSMK
jgi:hypothetical protein